MAPRKIVKEIDDVVYENLFAELLATVRVPEPLKVSEKITLECPTKDQVSALQGVTDENEAQKVIFGDQYDDAMELFGGASLLIWNAFMARYNKHFFGEADPGK